MTSGPSPLPDDPPGIVDRKAEHIRINLEEDVAAKGVTTGFERYRLVHRALPEIDLELVSLETSFLGRQSGRPPPLLMHDRGDAARPPPQPHPGGGRSTPPGGDGARLLPGAAGASRGARDLRSPPPLPRRPPARQPGRGPAQPRGGDGRLPPDRRPARGRRPGAAPQPAPGGSPAGGQHPLRRALRQDRGALRVARGPGHRQGGRLGDRARPGDRALRGRGRRRRRRRGGGHVLERGGAAPDRRPGAGAGGGRLRRLGAAHRRCDQAGSGGRPPGNPDREWGHPERGRRGDGDRPRRRPGGLRRLVAPGRGRG